MLAAAVVASVIAAGIVLTNGFSDESLGAALGTALLGGGVVGGAFVLVESMLLGAADRRSKSDALRRQLQSGEHFPAIDLAGQDLERLYLPNRILFRAELTSTRLRGASLQFCDLRWSIGPRADLSEADLSGADLSDTTLNGANLSGADLSDTSLRRADLRDADLRGALLRRTDLQGANLTGADLAGATVEGCIIDGTLLPMLLDPSGWRSVRHSPTTSWPRGVEIPPSTDIQHANISSMDLLAYLEYRQKVDSDKQADITDRSR